MGYNNGFMPWKETEAMSERMEMVSQYEREGETVSELFPSPLFMVTVLESVLCILVVVLFEVHR